jgi:hypothetical protein
MSRRVLVVWGLACCAWTPACRSFGEVPPELIAVLEARAAEPQPEAQRKEATVEIDSAWMVGRFHGVVVSRRGERPAFRAQLLPEVGTKVLDVIVTPELVHGSAPQAGLEVQHARAEGFRLKRSLMAFLAASVAEELSPLSALRVRGSRPVNADFGIIELDLEPILEGTRVRAVVNAQGQLIERRYQLDGVGWVETWSPAHEFRSHRFVLRLLDEKLTPIDPPPEALFLPPSPQDTERGP